MGIVKGSLHIIDLPIEVQTNILSHLDVNTQVTGLKVCRLWSDLITTAPLISFNRYAEFIDTPGSRLVLVGNRVHKFLCGGAEYEGVKIRFNLATGDIENWMVTPEGDKGYETTQTQDSGRVPSYNFLDDLVLGEFSHMEGWKNEDAVEDDELFSNGKRVRYRTPKSFVVKVRIELRKGLGIKSVEWGLNLNDGSGSRTNEQIAREWTIRSIVEKLCEMLKVEIDTELQWRGQTSERLNLTSKLDISLDITGISGAGECLIRALVTSVKA